MSIEPRIIYTSTGTFAPQKMTTSMYGQKLSLQHVQQIADIQLIKLQ